MNAPLRAIVVGCGAVGSGYDLGREGLLPLSHAGAFEACARVELVGGVDPSSSARDSFSDRWSVPAHSTLTEALAVGEIDMASVCSPPAAHLEGVRELIGSGVRAIWAEKPLSTDAGSAAELADACTANGVALQVNFLRRFDPVHRELAGRGMNVRHADFRFTGDLLNYGSHALDLFRWLVGEAASVSARTLTDREPEVTLTTAAGSTGSLIQVPSRGLDLFDCRLYTDDGGVLITALGEQVVTAQIRPSSLFTGVERAELGVPQAGTLERAMLCGADSLAAHLDSQAPLPCDGSDGVAAMRLYEAALASLDSGRPTILTEQ